MKKIGKHKNIISLIGACTQNGKHLFPSCQVAQLVVAKMHFYQKVHYPESPFQIINNYSPKWRWLVVDIYRAAKRRGKYPPLTTDTEVNSCFSIY